jgi:hypothetical protein
MTNELAFKQYEVFSNKFWEIENLKRPLSLSADKKCADDHFMLITVWIKGN